MMDKNKPTNKWEIIGAILMIAFFIALAIFSPV